MSLIWSFPSLFFSLTYHFFFGENAESFIYIVTCLLTMEKNFLLENIQRVLRTLKVQIDLDLI